MGDKTCNILHHSFMSRISLKNSIFGEFSGKFNFLFKRKEISQKFLKRSHKGKMYAELSDTHTGYFLTTNRCSILNY